MEPILRIRDNPILVAQARRRLRAKQIRPLLLITTIIGVCATLWGFADGGKAKSWSGVAIAFLVLVMMFLFIRGTAQAAAAIGEERASGILDFQRASPTSAWTDTFGYLIGCVAREYEGKQRPADSADEVQRDEPLGAQAIFRPRPDSA